MGRVRRAARKCWIVGTDFFALLRVPQCSRCGFPVAASDAPRSPHASMGSSRSSLLITGKTREGYVSFFRLAPFLKLGAEFEAKVFDLL